jgi:hypothetical protein
MNKSDLLEQIATLPRRFQTLDNVSMFSLVEAIGYFGFHDQISDADIRAALARCPNLFESGCSIRRIRECRVVGISR